MEYPVCKLIADHCIGNPKVLNKQRLDTFIYVNVPPEIAQHCVLIGVEEIIPDYVKVKDYTKFFVVEDKHPWIRVKSDKLNLKIGMHVYELEYVDTFSNATMNLYFAYILQDNDPEKPYIYMKRDKEV